MIDKPNPDSEQAQVDAVKQQIRAILGELRSLAKTEVAEEEFLAQLGRRTLETTGAIGFAIWQIGAEQEVSLVNSTGRTVSGGPLDGDQMEMHTRLIRSISASGHPTLIEPEAVSPQTGEVINPLPCLLLLKPLQDSALSDQYVLELYQRAEIVPAARTGYMRYLEEIGEIFAAWRARHQLRRQSTRHGRQQRLMEFIRDIHSSLHPREVAYAAANDGRVLVGCDRLSVLRFDSRNAKVLAVSGQDDFDNRSNVIRKQQALAGAVCRGQQSIWLGGESDGELPRKLQELADDYLNESHSRTLGIVPLFSKAEVTSEDNPEGKSQPRESVGAMIFEWFGQDVNRAAVSSDVQTLTDHVGRALGNAEEHHSVFLLWFWKAIGKWKWLIQAKTLPKTIAAAATALALVLFFALFPYPLNMRVEGTLQPKNQRKVYANMEGVVSRVLVNYKSQVKAGQPLLELRNDELDYKIAGAKGEMAELMREIEETTALALDSSLPAEQSGTAQARLSGLREKQTTIRQTLGSLERMASKLTVFSPIDGEVVSWDPVRELMERPVTPEDVVLVVAEMNSDWQMELYIPDRKYGHIVDAGDKPKVTFFAATDPGTSYEGSIREIESHASDHPQRGSTVRAFADFDQSNSPDLYVGAAITAKVHCGRTSIGYAWFYEVIEFFQSRVFF